jgi:hypothetical protein
LKHAVEVGANRFGNSSPTLTPHMASVALQNAPLLPG